MTTLGGAGVRIDREAEPTLTVPAVPDVPLTHPTGVGDAFRAGFLAGLGRGLPLLPAARLGCVVASRALSTVGSQTYRIDPADLLRTAEHAYGAEAAEHIAPAVKDLS